jgi:sugar/nucleoside kinase (ribokinase family)
MGAHQKDLLCFGEISWDRLWLLDELPRGSGDCHLLFEQEMPGGCALNTAGVLRALGARVTLGGNAVGDDARGRAIREHLRAAGVDDRVVLRPGIRTPFCQCLVSKRDGHRDFVLEHSGIQDFRPESAAELARLVEECRAGRYSHAFVQPYIREAARRLLEDAQGAPQDSKMWVMIQDQAPDSEYVPLVDAIQISLPEDEDFTPARLAELARGYQRGRLATVFVTHGARGVAICEKEKAPRIIPGVPAREVRDTTGCGDAFRAGLMAGLARGWGLDEAVALGQKVGAVKAGILGSHFTRWPEGAERV